MRRTETYTPMVATLKRFHCVRTVILLSANNFQTQQLFIRIEHLFRSKRFLRDNLTNFLSFGTVCFCPSETT